MLELFRGCSELLTPKWSMRAGWLFLKAMAFTLLWNSQKLIWLWINIVWAKKIDKHCILAFTNGTGLIEFKKLCSNYDVFFNSRQYAQRWRYWIKAQICNLSGKPQQCWVASLCSQGSTRWHHIPQPLPCLQPHVVPCFVSCGPLNLWFMLYFPFLSRSFVMEHYRFWEPA